GSISCYNNSDSSWKSFATWGSNDGPVRVNSSNIYGDCLNGNTLQLQVAFQCFNLGGYNRFSEEKVWWNSPTSALTYLPGLEVNVNNLSNTLTTKNDNWTFECKANDNILNSTAMNTSVLIGNAIPYMQVARISPTPTTYTNQDLLGYCNASDYDGTDQLTYYYSWYRNGSLNNSGKTSTYYYSEDDSEDAFASSGVVSDASNAVDELWNTYAYTNSDMEEYGLILINYTIPASIDGAKLEYSIRSSACEAGDGGSISCYNNSDSSWKSFATWGSNDGPVRVNSSNIYGDCLNGNTLQLQVAFQCFNLGGYNRFSEEKVWWTFENKTWYPLGLEVNVNNLSNTLTTKNDNWTLRCTANDNSTNSTWLNSSNTMILNSAPNSFTLSAPATGTSTYNRTINFEWNTGSDNDSDGLTYNLLVDDDINFGAPEVNQTGLSAINYNLVSDLALDKTYYWKVRSYDGTSYSAYTSIWDLTVDSYLDIRAVNDTIDFGTLGPSISDNTSDNIPLPFLIENNGNTLMNVSLDSTELFVQAPLPSSNYRFKIDNSSEVISFNWLTSLFDWTDIPSGMISAIDSLKYQNATDTAEVDILVIIPNDELAGAKQANITFTASLAE
nr:hypothetical protein [Nanoarchaeum sp.]